MDILKFVSMMSPSFERSLLRIWTPWIVHITSLPPSTTQLYVTLASELMEMNWLDSGNIEIPMDSVFVCAERKTMEYYCYEAP